MSTIAQDFALVVAYTTGRITEHQFRKLISSSEHGADAGTPVSGPSHCSPASPRAGDNGDGLEGKPPVGLHEKHAVQAAPVELVQVDPERRALCRSGPDARPPGEGAVVALASALEPLPTADRALLGVAAAGVRMARLRSAVVAISESRTSYRTVFRWARLRGFIWHWSSPAHRKR